MPSQQNLGIILENEMSENWYYFENWVYSQNKMISLEYRWLILLKNLTDFDPPK